MKYLFNCALGLDLFASAILGGDPGETLSGRTGYGLMQGKRWAKVCAPIIDFIMRKKGHCIGAIMGDEIRAKAVIVDYGGKL